MERKKLRKPQKERIARGQKWICGRCQEKIDSMGFDIHHKNRDSSDNDISNLNGGGCLGCKTFGGGVRCLDVFNISKEQD